ncbi:hypothetical protein KC573_01890 [candidate division WWE3 bacterium]|uniref:Uncharacterized protein n=1 Tax=candidate division WWE3 bacterium TaxID=2053526 RepID=A0A955RW79_UNCKA|nr:hypothetical protein [candidate division WWE3 bacterium]
MTTTDKQHIKEQAARKIGEVLAFSEIGLDLLERGETALENVFEADFLDDCTESFETQKEDLLRIASKLDVEQIVLDKADSTKNKVFSMQELYLKGEWDDAVEVLEWMGFFEGGALVHWGLIKGVADTHRIGQLTTVAEDALDFHQEFVRQIVTQLFELGGEL